MVGDTQFGSQSCPIQLEEEEEEEEAQTKRSAPPHLASALEFEQNMESKVESIPSPSAHSRATAPNSPSIRDSGNLRLVKSTQVKMELDESAEREAEALLFTSLRFDQSDNRSECPKSISSGSIQTEWELGHGNDAVKQQGCKRGQKSCLPTVNHDVLIKGEDVCFACLDGGDLILCDKRSCPKGYHLECTGRELEFFDQKGQWFCGWHVCATCSKAAAWHCYTCPTAYCNGCVKETGFLYLMKGEGLCEDCYKVVYMLENNLSTDSMGIEVNFDDEETYECYFREYWKDLKRKLPVSWQQIEEAFKASGVDGRKCGNLSIGEEKHEVSRESDVKRFSRPCRRFKRRKGTTNVVFDDVSTGEYDDDDADDKEQDESDDAIVQKPKSCKQQEFTSDGWASHELINFLHSVNESSKKPLSMRAVKRILWNYIDSNKLINPRRLSHVRCDKKLQRLFGKKHIARRQMVDLLRVHLAKNPGVMFWGGDEDTEHDIDKEKPVKNEKSSKTQLNIDEEIQQMQQNSRKKVADSLVLDNRADYLEQKFKNKVGASPEIDNRADSLQKQKSKTKVGKARNSEADASAYAAIDTNNISLIYLKRPLLEDLRNDPDFFSKVMKAFVRLRVNPSSVKNAPCYQLVQIIGVKQVLVTRNNVEQTNVMLEVLNLQRREEISIGMVSSRDFTEDECCRLRLCVKKGYLKPITVGELRDKARALRETKVKNYFETELIRLTHLRDRANEKGRKKELRECIEKIQILSSPAERERQLEAPIDITIDPSLCYISENDENTMRENPEKHNAYRAVDQMPWESKGMAGKPHNRSGNRCMVESASPENFYVRALDRRAKVDDYCQQGPGCVLYEKVTDCNGQVDGHGLGNSNSRGLNDVCAKDNGGWGMGTVDEGKADGGDGVVGGHTMNDDGWGDIEGETKKGDCWGEVQGVTKHDDAAGAWKVNDGGSFHGHDSGVDHGYHYVGGHKERNVGSIKKKQSEDPNMNVDQQDDGWGQSPSHHSQDDGVGDSKNIHREQDGWGQAAGNSGGVNIVDRRQQNDGWGRSAGRHSQDGGWRDSKNIHRQDDDWGQSAGHHSKVDVWGHGAMGNTKDHGLGDVAGANDGWGHTKKDSGGESGGDIKKNGWGDDAKARAHIKNDGPGRGGGCHSRASWGHSPCEWTGSPSHSTWNQHLDNRWDNRGARTGMERSRDREGQASSRIARFDRRNANDRAEPRDDRPSGLISTYMKDDQLDVSTLGRASGPHDREREKQWYYHDLRKNLQGPFSMHQLRRWEKTKLFPPDLRIWRATESPDAAILLTDALVGRFPTDLPPGFAPNHQQGTSPLQPGHRDDMRHGGGRPGSRWQQHERGEGRISSDEHAAGPIRGGRPWSPCESGRDGGSVGRGRAVFSEDYQHSHRNSGDDSRFNTRKKDFPCRYFARGMCRNGKQCDFRH